MRSKPLPVFNHARCGGILLEGSSGCEQRSIRPLFSDGIVEVSAGRSFPSDASVSIELEIDQLAVRARGEDFSPNAASQGLSPAKVRPAGLGPAVGRSSSKAAQKTTATR